MILARVIGHVWATRKHIQLSSFKLLVVRPYCYYNPSHDTEQLVAVDNIGAGIGEDVIVCLGSPARWSLGDENIPVDATVCGIVDSCQFVKKAFTRESRRMLHFIGGLAPQNMEWI